MALSGSNPSGFQRRLTRLIFPLGSVDAPAPLRAIERRYARFMPLAILLGLLASVFEGLGIGMLAPLLTIMLDHGDAASYPGLLRKLVGFATQGTPLRPLAALSVMVLCLVLAKATIQVINARLMAWVEGNAGRDIRDGLAEKTLHLDYDFFLKNDASRLITIVDTDSWKATDAVRAIFQIAVSAATVIVFAAFLIIADWRLFAMVCAGGALVRVVQGRVSRHLMRLSRTVVSSNHALGERMIQIIRAIRVIRIFGQERQELDAFRVSSEHVRCSMLDSDRKAALSMPMIEVILSSVIVGVLLTADQLQIGLPMIIAFLVLLYRLQSPLLAISHASLRLATLRGSVDEIEWLLAADERAPRSDVTVSDRLPFDQPLRFEAVSYDYDPRSQASCAADAISFTIAPRAIVALVGRSGAGKSTIVNLLCRLIEPTGGRIMLGDVDITQTDAGSWRSHLAIAGQDLEMVAGSVAANIAYGVPDIARDAIEEAARLADAHEFIALLPDGYDTMLGALGFGLSGGQRQRIGLARALIRRPEILILDEATSAIDGISERTIMRLLDEHRLFGRAIVISHRVETLRICTTGIEIADGRVVFEGPVHDMAWFRAAEAATRTTVQVEVQG